MFECSVYSLILYGIIGAIIYRAVPKKLEKLVLIVVSLVVYIIWAQEAVIVLIVETIVGYLAIIAIQKKENRKLCLVTSLTLLVTVLTFFKYAGILNSIILKRDLSAVIIPLGISYFSFRIISAIVDVYNGKISEISFISYSLYVVFFPQIICGPIAKYSDFSVNDDKNILSKNKIEQAIYRIVKGIFYKLAIADRLSTYVDNVFGQYKAYPGQVLIFAAILYTIELYADFAGYSEIVIGLSNLYGFDIPENFERPYFSKSIKEFWRRWHISLSIWLRDYIYIPLGGSRKGELRKKLNIMIVFLISGIWHGNTWSYVIWGIWHGVWNLVLPTRWKSKFGELIGTVSTFIIVSIGWICFKLNNIYSVGEYIVGMTRNWDLSYNGIVISVMPFSNDYSSLPKAIYIAIIVFVAFVLEYREENKKDRHKIARLVFYIAVSVLFGVWGQNSFIYANY